MYLQGGCAAVKYGAMRHVKSRLRCGEIRADSACEIFCPFGAKCLGVTAVRSHFDGVGAQSNAECGIRNAEFRTEAMECVLGSPYS